MITGLQSSTFSKIIATIAEIHAVFSRAVRAERLEECQIITSYRGMSALELSNCHFTSHKEMAEGSELVLSTDIDPYRYLAHAVGMTLCHTKNAVLYFERQGSNDDNYKFSDYYHEENYHSHTSQCRYKPGKPVIFGVGNIVKVQASFMTVALKQGKFKTMMVLRGITLIDGTFSQALSKKTTNIEKHNTKLINNYFWICNIFSYRCPCITIPDHFEIMYRGNLWYCNI